LTGTGDDEDAEYRQKDIRSHTMSLMDEMNGVKRKG
jgi:hypothetical protein